MKLIGICGILFMMVSTMSEKKVYCDDCMNYDSENDICDSIVWGGECDEECVEYCLEHYPWFFKKKENKK